MIRAGRFQILSVAALCLWSLSVAAGASPDPPPEAASPADPSQQIGRLLARSRALEGSDLQDSVRLAEEALRESRAHSLPARELASLWQVGRSRRLINDYPGTLRAVQQGMLLAESLHDDATRGELIVLRGTVEWNRAKLPEATVSMMEALRLGEALGDKHLQLGAQYGQGLVRARLDDLDGALGYLEAAFQLARETGDGRMDAVLNSLGCVYLQRKDYPRAKDYFEKALEVARAHANQRLSAYVMLNLGQLYTESGDQAAAGAFLNDAMAICRTFQLQRGMADILYLMAGRHRRLGQYDDALKDLADAWVLAQAIKNPDLFVSIYQEYIQTEEARGHFQSALNYTRLLAGELETVRGDKARQQSRALQEHYEAESRAHQIKLLQRDQELQRSAVALKSAELSQMQTRYTGLAVTLALGSVCAAALVNRQRKRVRLTTRMLAETRAEKREVEQEDARKARLLSIAARDLSESEARFRCAFEHSALGLALVGRDGRWLRVNAALCKIVGYSDEELLATDSRRITHPDDLPHDRVLLDRLLAGEIPSYHVEKRYLRKDGQEVWVGLDVALVRDPGTAAPLYFVSQVQDIGERRQAQAQLLAAKEEAEKANEAKTGFLSRVSHELRTPLNAILGFGQLLELDDFGERQNQSVAHILVAGRHLLELINEVLDITQLESGRLLIATEPTPVRETVAGVLDLLSPLAAQARVEIVPGWQSIDPALTVQADPRRLRQVLLNMLSNAINYNRPGGEIHVTCHEADGKVCVEIRDTGMGIAPEGLQRIFEPFTRLPETARVPGTGLGLSLSKGLMEAMGGALRVRSQPGEGSTFSLELARSRDDQHTCAIEPLVLELIAPERADH